MQDHSEINKLIIQMLMQNAQNDDRMTRVDPEIDYNYQKGFGIAPQLPTTIPPDYIQPFRQREPQMENWWRGLKS